MAFKFDLSGLQKAAVPPFVARGPCSNECVEEFAPSRPLRLQSDIPQASIAAAMPQLTFSLGLPQPQTSLVRRFATPVLQRFGLAAEPEKCAERADDPENDQYTIQPGRSMIWSVLFHNDTGKKHPNSLLGDYGHIERLSSWIHLVSGIGFMVYAIVRPFSITTEHTLAESFTTAAAGAVAFAFLSSTAYHITAPSKRLTYWTRQLDYIGIYVALSLGSVADYGIATRSFQNVSILSVIDGPLAATVTMIFFLSRRSLLPSDATWDTWLGGCTLSFGLMRKGHIDLDQTGIRQATSFLITIAYFVTVPTVFNNFGTRNAITVLMLEFGCLALLIIGMFLDNTIAYPDKLLSQGKGPKFLVCKSCGCIGALLHTFDTHSQPTVVCVFACLLQAARTVYGTCSPSLRPSRAPAPASLRSRCSGDRHICLMNVSKSFATLATIFSLDMTSVCMLRLMVSILERPRCSAHSPRCEACCSCRAAGVAVVERSSGRFFASVRMLGTSTLLFGRRSPRFKLYITPAANGRNESEL